MNRSMINFIGIAGGVIGIISVFLPWFGVIGSLMTLMLPMAVFLLLLYGAAIGYSIYNLIRKDEPSRVGPILLIGVGFITFFAPLGLYYASYVFGLSAGFYLALLAGGLILTSGVIGIIATRKMPLLPQRYFGQAKHSQNQSQANQPWLQQNPQQPWGQPQQPQQWQPPQQPQQWGQPQQPQQWQPSYPSQQWGQSQQPQQWGQSQQPQQWGQSQQPQQWQPSQQPQQWQPPQQPQQWEQSQQPQQWQATQPPQQPQQWQAPKKESQGPIQGWQKINPPKNR